MRPNADSMSLGPSSHRIELPWKVGRRQHKYHAVAAAQPVHLHQDLSLHAARCLVFAVTSAGTHQSIHLIQEDGRGGVVPSKLKENLQASEVLSAFISSEPVSPSTPPPSPPEQALLAPQLHLSTPASMPAHPDQLLTVSPPLADNRRGMYVEKGGATLGGHCLG